MECWLLNVDVDTVYKTGVHITKSYRSVVRGCQIHNSYQYTSNAGYGMYISDAASACLIENNNFNTLTTGVIMNGSISGNVIAYNYMTDMRSTTYPNAVRPGTGAHGAHPLMNLFEGNYLNGPSIAMDFTWGSSSHNTFFRNRQATDNSKTSGVVGVEIWKGQTYCNFVGNIFGTNGFETLYESNDLYRENDI